jgi:thiamine pyrophosphate-dependent acetolactate synthase large subunit-like protein
VKVYEALARAFADEGTTAVFDMMGDANMYWLNALSQLGVGIYDVRHEGAGLAMADGWARVSGAPGVCSTTSGPGTTQLATTMVVAGRARTPLVAFCGDTATGHYDAQHFDQERFAAAIEAGFVRLDAPGRAYDCVREAFTLARRESRPVLLSVPSDVQQEPFDGDPAYTPSSAATLDLAAAPDPARLQEAAGMIADATRPLLLVGRGAVQSGARDVVLRVAERTGALLATTLLAKNWLDDAKYHAGIAGGYGTRTARALMRQADLVLVAGASVSPYTSDGGELFRDARIVQIDTRPDLVMGDGRTADCLLRGDARLTLEELERILETRGFRATGFRTPEVESDFATAFDDPATFELEPGTVDPREACLVLDDVMPPEFGLVLGSGQQIRFATMLLRRQRPFVVAQHHFGCIGQGLTTAIGAVIATGMPAFLVEGDGGMMMHLAEFETAVRYRLPLLVVVMNDEALGAELHKSAAVGLDPELAKISTPDLGAVGTALGGRGALVRSIDELRAAAGEFAARPGPMLVDVRISRRVLSIPYRRMFHGEDV